MQFLLILTASHALRLLSQVPRAKLERSLRYGRVTTLTMLETTLPNAVALGLAALGWGAWALVVRDLLVSALTLGLETWASGYRFRAAYSRPAARQLMDFARPMFVSRAIEILVMKADKLAVGIFLGNAAIGLLDRARFVADMGVFVMRPVERASLNLFSRVQDDLGRLSRSYGIVNYFLVRSMFAGGCVLLLTPNETIELLFGEEWLGAAPALRWLAVHAALFPIFSMIKVLVIARNQVIRLARISAIQALVLIPGTLLAAWLESFEGVAAVVALTTIAGTGLGIAWSRDLASVSYRQLLGVPVLAGVLAAVLLGAIEWSALNDWVPRLARPFVVGAAFVAGVAAMEPRRIRHELGYLRRQFALGPADDSTV
jgi:PST family polysaccharide transporter